MSAAAAPVLAPQTTPEPFDMPEQRQTLLDVRRHHIGSIRASLKMVRSIEAILDLDPAHFDLEPSEGAAPKGPAPTVAHSPTHKEGS